ncbi:hypothetical protein AKJ09_00220 [Labilithrix luteola]|uniref:Uncharacterized protein n=2 Tax=Labilithrix luteola TaxID=1391654 RepID=A0A0K1PJH0_9BACT|nr:hypothetical protein AKJ09_00220 [Labilithrix luteola]
MTMSAGELAIWNGLPVRVFPYGSHVFPADLEAVRELGEVLREDLRREHRVAIELIARVQAGTQDSTLAGSLPLPRLCDFLLRRRPAFDRAAHRRIAENTLAQGRLRLEELRALNAPDVILDHTSAEIARVAEPGWSPSINPANLLPNVGATLSAIDLDDLSDEERTLYFDITTLVLLAAQCCTTFDAKALDDAPWLEELAWTRLVDEDEDVPAPPVDVVQFRGTVYSEHCQRLECAIVPADRTAQFGATALLAVSIPEPAE